MCFTVSDSNNGQWWDELNSSEVVAEDAWKAFIMAVANRQNKGREPDDLRLWSFERTFHELYSDEEVYWSHVVMNLNTGQCEQVRSPVVMVQEIDRQLDKVKKAIGAIETICEPYPVELLAPHGETPPALELRQAYTGLQYLRGFYEGVQKAEEGRRIAIQAWIDDMHAKGAAERAESEAKLSEEFKAKQAAAKAAQPAKK